MSRLDLNDDGVHRGARGRGTCAMKTRSQRKSPREERRTGWGAVGEKVSRMSVMMSKAVLDDPCAKNDERGRGT